MPVDKNIIDTLNSIIEDTIKAIAELDALQDREDFTEHVNLSLLQTLVHGAEFFRQNVQGLRDDYRRSAGV